MVAKPDLVAPGNLIDSTRGQASNMVNNYPQVGVNYNSYATGINGTSPSYMQLSGTSMATPFVSAAAALIVQQYPTLAPDQVKARLMLTANKTVFPATSSYTDPTTGITYYSQYDIFTIGAGYLNIANALANTTVAPAAMRPRPGSGLHFFGPTGLRRYGERGLEFKLCLRFERGLGIERGLGQQRGLGIERRMGFEQLVSRCRKCGLGIERGLGQQRGLGIERGLGIDFSVFAVFRHRHGDHDERRHSLITRRHTMRPTLTTTFSSGSTWSQTYGWPSNLLQDLPHRHTTIGWSATAVWGCSGRLNLLATASTSFAGQCPQSSAASRSPRLPSSGCRGPHCGGWPSRLATPFLN